MSPLPIAWKDHLLAVIIGIGSVGQGEGSYLLRGV